MLDRDRRFEALTRDHAALMAAAIRRVCGRRFQTLVPDVRQEVYLALWKRLGSGNEIRHPASYLYKVALTTALATVRRFEAEARAASLDEAEDRLASPPAAGLPARAAAERAVLLRQVLALLDPEHRRAIRSWLAGFNHVEVAELHGWTESVARHRIYRGIERLRESLKEHQIDGNAELAGAGPEP